MSAQGADLSPAAAHVAAGCGQQLGCLTFVQHRNFAVVLQILLSFDVLGLFAVDPQAQLWL